MILHFTQCVELFYSVQNAKLLNAFEYSIFIQKICFNHFISVLNEE